MALCAVVIYAANWSLYPMKSKYRPSLLEEQEEMQKKIGIRLRQLREATGLSQEKFANHHGLDRRQISRIENGTNVEINTIVSYCRALEVTVQEFFIGIE